MSEWAAGHSVRPAIVPRKEPGMFEVPDGGLSAIAENRKNNRGLPGRLRSTNIHSEPDIVNRLIRMVEELIERDDLTPDADPTWYRNRLREIKEEVADAKERGSETGLGDRPVTASETPRAAVQGNGGSLSGD